MHVENAFQSKGVKYLNIRIDDTPHYKISKFFKIAYEFMENALTNNETNEEDADMKEITQGLQNLGFSNSYSDKDKLNSTIESISSWTYKNKIMQILFKKLYEKYNSKNRILIHCSLGMSRSPTLAIMYVMKKFRMKFEQAFNFVKFQRDASNPICSFLYELEDFEKNDFQFYDETKDNMLTHVTHGTHATSKTNSQTFFNCQYKPIQKTSVKNVNVESK